MKTFINKCIDIYDKYHKLHNFYIILISVFSVFGIVILLIYAPISDSAYSINHAFNKSLTKNELLGWNTFLKTDKNHIYYANIFPENDNIRFATPNAKPETKQYINYEHGMYRHLQYGNNSLSTSQKYNHAIKYLKLQGDKFYNHYYNNIYWFIVSLFINNWSKTILIGWLIITIFYWSIVSLIIFIGKHIKNKGLLFRKK